MKNVFEGFNSVQIGIVIVVTLLFGISSFKNGIETIIVGLVCGFGLSYWLIARYNKRKNMSADEIAKAKEEKIKNKTEIKKAKLLAKEEVEKHKANIATYKQQQKTARVNPLVCPKCGSSEITPLGKDKKSFSWGKAAGGTLLSGSVGALAGYTGKDTGKTVFVCMNCGKQFKK